MNTLVLEDAIHTWHSELSIEAGQRLIKLLEEHECLDDKTAYIYNGQSYCAYYGDLSVIKMKG